MALVSVLVGQIFGGRKGTEFRLPGQVNGFVIDATVSSQHDDELEVTDNPVEEGVDVTDHSVKKPATLTITGLHSNTPLDLGASLRGLAATGIASAARKAGGPFAATAATVGAGVLTNLAASALSGKSRSKNAYDYFLDLQNKRIPFTVVTGLRQYENMLLTKLSITRDAKTGQALNFTASMREIRVVQNQSIPIKNTASGVDASGRTKLGKKEGQEMNQSKRSILKNGYDSLLAKLGGG